MATAPAHPGGCRCLSPLDLIDRIPCANAATSPTGRAVRGKVGRGLLAHGPAAGESAPGPVQRGRAGSPTRDCRRLPVGGVRRRLRTVLREAPDRDAEAACLVGEVFGDSGAGKDDRPVGMVLSSSSLRRNGAALPCAVHLGLHTICAPCGFPPSRRRSAPPRSAFRHAGAPCRRAAHGPCRAPTRCGRGRCSPCRRQRRSWHRAASDPRLGAVPGRDEIARVDDGGGHHAVFVPWSRDAAAMPAGTDVEQLGGHVALISKTLRRSTCEMPSAVSFSSSTDVTALPLRPSPPRRRTTSMRSSSRPTRSAARWTRSAAGQPVPRGRFRPPASPNMSATVSKIAAMPLRTPAASHTVPGPASP